MKLNDVQKAVIALIIANVIWGAAAPIFKWSLQSTPPFTLGFLRFMIAALVLYPFVRNNLNIQRKHVLPLFILSIFGVTINIAFFFMGLNYSDSINAPIIASSAPIFIIILGSFFLKDKIKSKTLIGGIIGLIGVFLIVVIPSIEKGIDASLIGNLFFIASTLGGVIHALLLKKIAPYYKPLTLVFWTFIIGSFGFLPLFADEVFKVGFLPIIDAQVIIGILFGAFLSSAFAYYLHTWAMKNLPVEDVGLFTYVDPIIAVLIAVPLLGEYPTVHFFIGSFFVFLGIYVAEGRIHYHPLHLLHRNFAFMKRKD